MSPVATPLADLLERDFTAQVIGNYTNPGLARQLGWKCYHVLRSKGSEAGYPDWTLVRERVMFLELKREAGRLSDAQKGWLRALIEANAEAYVVRPSQLELLAAVLTARQHRSLELTHATWQEIA